jgi:hypothetical protein
MSEENSEDIVPQHQSGIETNTESSATFNSVEEATSFYQQAKHLLLHVNDWHTIAGAATADFQLTDEKGNEVNRSAQKGDHFKIDIPGPGPVTGDGYDWVQVEAVEEKNEKEKQSIALRVRPATNPNNDRKDVAHFFSDESTSCFMIKREGATITAGVYGRNEKPNTNTETWVDKARNTAIATGAITGFAKLQWKSLVNGLVKRD